MNLDNKSRLPPGGHHVCDPLLPFRGLPPNLGGHDPAGFRESAGNDALEGQVLFALRLAGAWPSPLMGKKKRAQF
ncbi:hypothetical protein D3C80_1612420 [compost metagenome]